MEANLSESFIANEKPKSFDRNNLVDVCGCDCCHGITWSDLLKWLVVFGTILGLVAGIFVWLFILQSRLSTQNADIEALKQTIHYLESCVKCDGILSE